MFWLRRSVARTAVRPPPHDSDTDTEVEDGSAGDSDSDVPHGVPVAAPIMAPSSPEDDGMGDYYWLPVLLSRADNILLMQRDELWRVGSMVAPLFLHVWLRRPRRNDVAV